MMRWGLFLLGAGVGAVAGVPIDRLALLPGSIAVAVGLYLLAIGGRSRTRDLIGDVTAAQAAMADDDEAPDEKPDRPTLSGLGTTVERVLRLAEEQAADHIAQAKATAAEIVAQARAEADRMKTD